MVPSNDHPPRRFYCLDAFTNAFRDLKNHLTTTYFTAALLALPLLFATFFIATGRIAFGFLLQMFATVVIGVWLTGVMIRATWEYATGSDPGVGGLLDRGTNARLFALTGTYLLLLLLALGAVLLGFLPFVVTTLATVGSIERIEDLFTEFAPVAIASFVLSVIIAIVLLAIVGLRYSVAGQASILEGAGPVTALQRSATLMKRHWFDVILLWLMLGGVSIAVGLVTNTPGFIASFGSSFEEPGPIGFSFGQPMEGGPALVTGAALVLALSTYLTQVVMTPVTVIAMTNFYLSLRGEEAAILNLPPAEVSPPLTETVRDGGGEQPVEDAPGPQ